MKIVPRDDVRISKECYLRNNALKELLFKLGEVDMIELDVATLADSQRIRAAAWAAGKLLKVKFSVKINRARKIGFITRG